MLFGPEILSDLWLVLAEGLLCKEMILKLYKQMLKH